MLTQQVADLSGLQDLIPPVAQALGVEPASALLGVGVIVAGANVIGRVIPDDKKGPLGILRKVAKTIGLFVPNKVTKGISTVDVAKSVLKDEAIDELAKVAFPGLQRDSKGRFLPKDSQ